MVKSNKYVDPNSELFQPPPQKTRWEALRTFVYDGDSGACLGRTPTSWAQITFFYLIFYACLAGFFAICMWGLLQSIDPDHPTYLLDRSIIGTSPGLASRPMPPEGRDTVMLFDKARNIWITNEEDVWSKSLDNFLSEYQTTVPNSKKCSYETKKDDNSVCEVNPDEWGSCTPNGTSVSNICMFFKINKVFNWRPEYYKNVESLPKEMPESLKTEITTAIQKSSAEVQKVWISCVGRNENDQKNLGNVTYYPRQGFPAYYYPFHNQKGFRSPVVALHLHNPSSDVEINMECRSWALNIEQDRKEQLGVLNYKIKIQ